MFAPLLDLRERPMSLMPGRQVCPKTVADPAVSPLVREQYRQLAATLHNAQTSSGVKTLMISSALAGEGKTLTAANLALTFSEAYERTVLLVDADLRRPSLHRVVTSEEPSGRHSLAAAAGWTLHVRQVNSRLGLWTRERPSSAPMAELMSDRMPRVICEARQVYDWVIVDTPPLALIPDASLLATAIDGVVFVVRAGSTPLDLVRRALTSIDAKKTVGVVLNAALNRPHDARYGYHEYYSQISDPVS